MFQIDAGDQSLKKHIEEGQKNAQYTSARIQNDLINLCGRTIQEILFEKVRKSEAYSILADETSDMSGKEQLSIGVRFFDQEKMIVREECMGFIELSTLDAKSIADAIDGFIQSHGLDPAKCVGQGYDGASTMSGVHGGVQTILRETYPKALFFHCASHKINLVVNDTNTVPEIRNTIGTIKEIINFFRESVLRRKYAPNIPAFCETRWTQKYKSISIFHGSFKKLVDGLDALAKEGNPDTRKTAFLLQCAATKSVFIISVFTIAKYSAIIEPVVNALQAKSLDLFSCSRHVNRILTVLNEHRTSADSGMQSIFDEAQEFADEIGVGLHLPRVASRQTHRSNPPSSDHNDYWKKSILIPYLDSLILSLKERFAPVNLPAFSLFSLHPFNMLDKTKEEMIQQIKNFNEFYGVDNLEHEIELWRATWREKSMPRTELEKLDLCQLLEETQTFFPSIRKTLLIALALPCTTCTIERSFSTLRRVKTWLRTTMIEDRLTGK